MNILCNDGGFVINLWIGEIGPEWGSLPPNGGALAIMILYVILIFLASDCMLVCILFLTAIKTCIFREEGGE